MHARSRARTRTHTHFHTHINTLINTLINTNTCTLAHTHINTHIHKRMHAREHTQTHTHTNYINRCEVTFLTWSENGERLISADKKGKVRSIAIRNTDAPRYTPYKKPYEQKGSVRTPPPPSHTHTHTHTHTLIHTLTHSNIPYTQPHTCLLVKSVPVL